MTYTISIDLGKKCDECKKPGAAPSGICMGCTAKAFRGKPMKSATGRAVQNRIKEQAKTCWGKKP